jgi:hypothetical protein
MKSIQKMMLGLACMGMLIPQSAFTADQNVRQAVNNNVIDVALNAEGSLEGKVISSSKSAVNGTEVVVYQGSKEIVRTVTNKEGEFKVNNLKNGVYTVTADKGMGEVRVWETAYAPPAAEQNVVLMSGQRIVRGQNGTPNWVPLVFTTGLIGGAGYAIYEVSTNDKDPQRITIPATP